MAAHTLHRQTRTTECQIQDKRRSIACNYHQANKVKKKKKSFKNNESDLLCQTHQISLIHIVCGEFASDILLNVKSVQPIKRPETNWSMRTSKTIFCNFKKMSVASMYSTKGRRGKDTTGVVECGPLCVGEIAVYVPVRPDSCRVLYVW